MKKSADVSGHVTSCGQGQGFMALVIFAGNAQRNDFNIADLDDFKLKISFTGNILLTFNEHLVLFNSLQHSIFSASPGF